MYVLFCESCFHEVFHLYLYSAIPVETLHTVLLGCCKYMIRSFMDSISTKQKKEILALLAAFPCSGLTTRITGNICYYYKSFVGRDFKAFMQMALFIIERYLSEQKTECWLLLSKVELL